MILPRQLAIVRDYDELIAAMSARAIELQISRKALAEVAGIADGSASGALAPGGLKSFGRTTLGPLLGALGLRLIIEEDEEALKHVKNRLGDAKTSYMLNGVKNKPVILKFSRKYMRKLGKESGRTRMEKIHKRTRSRVARIAAKARWHPPQVTEMSPEQREKYLTYQAQKARRAIAKRKRRRGALPPIEIHVNAQGAAARNKPSTTIIPQRSEDQFDGDSREHRKASNAHAPPRALAADPKRRQARSPRRKAQA